MFNTNSKTDVKLCFLLVKRENVRSCHFVTSLIFPVSPRICVNIGLLMQYAHVFKCICILPTCTRQTTDSGIFRKRLKDTVSQHSLFRHVESIRGRLVQYSTFCLYMKIISLSPHSHLGYLLLQIQKHTHIYTLSSSMFSTLRGEGLILYLTLEMPPWNSWLKSTHHTGVVSLQ